MKVILEAFAGKLRSGILDFPENTPPEIRMILDFIPKLELFEKLPPDMPLRRQGSFVFTGGHLFIEGESVKRYVLVGVS